MESVQLAIVSTGGKWARFVIATAPKRLLSDPLYWNGTQWVSEKWRAVLYANPQLAERDMERLKAKM